MKRYDIAIIISEPGLDLEDMEATNTLAATIRDASREKLMEEPRFKALIEAFESAFGEEK